MHVLLPSWPLFIAFLAASLVLAVTPGPGVLYIVTRSLTQGKRAGLASVAGVALGNLGNAIGAAIGLAAWFAVSSSAFLVVKYLGAAYLIWLGCKSLLASNDQAAAGVSLPSATPARIFRDGVVVALFNPKTALFFAAFLPQFMGPRMASAASCILLGCIFVLIAATTDCLYALAAGTVAPLLQGNASARRLKRGLSAGIFLGLGFYTAFSGHRRAT